MTRREIQKIISNSATPDYYTEKIVLEINVLQRYQINAKGLLAVWEIFDREIQAFAKLKLPLPKSLNHSNDTFKFCLDQIIDYINRIGTFVYLDEAARNWSRVYSLIWARLDQLNRGRYLVSASFPEVAFLVEIFRQTNSEESVEAAYDYLFNNTIRNFQDKNGFRGIVLAYQYQDGNKKYSKYTLNEKKSLADLVKRYDNFVSDLGNETTQLGGEVVEIKRKWEQTVKDELSNYEQRFQEWFNESKQSNIDFANAASEKISGLESTYSDKLRLQKPAEYWSLRSKALQKEATKWMYWLMGSASAAVLILFIVLMAITKESLANIFESTGSAVRWSLVFVTLISFLAYAIRNFAKLAFSAYHLARDAEEREQLVYVYLSLSNESAPDSESRLLILQSIFSRADSGLLKEDSSPTMPGGLFNKLSSSS